MDKNKMNIKNNINLLGVIPARGGSKGLKNKNLRLVNKEPLISYTIRQALTYKGLFKVIVTTDSASIAAVAKKYKAEVPFLRPANLARDNSPMLDVLKHALLFCEEHYQRRIQGIVLLDPTSPLRNKEDILKMISLFIKKRPDLVIGVKKSKRNPYFNMLKKNKEGYAELVIKSSLVRRQDAPDIYDIANNCWIFSREAVLNNWRMPEKTLCYEISSSYIDIDKEDDLNLFKWYLNNK